MYDSRSWRTRRYLVAAASCLGALGLSGCGSLSTENGLSAAQVRFVEVSPGAPEMDFYVNGTGAAYGVGYESFTSYLPIIPGTASLSVSRAGGTQALTTTQTVLNGGHQYTAVLAHGTGGMQERIYADQDTPAPTGQTSIRVLNAVEGINQLSFYVTPTGGAALATPVVVWTVPSGAAGSYATLPAEGSYTIAATVAGSAVNLPIANVTVKAISGAVRSVVFAGALTSNGHRGAVGFTLADADAR